jgi:hypothetical protein
MPPRAIWQDHRRLKAHFDAVKAKRDSKHGDEAPEGTMQDARDGRNVTLRNRIAQQVVESHDLYDQLYGADSLT